MKDNVAANPFVRNGLSAKKKLDKYYSVEFSFQGLEALYQFKVWAIGSSSIRVLVNEDSEVLPLMKVGDTLHMKYYSTDGSSPFEQLATEVQNITRHDEGRLKGHYLVGLEILDNQAEDRAFLSYISN